MDTAYTDFSLARSDPRSVVQGKNYRFTVLTERMIRMEYSPDGVFTDAPTQIVLNRRFPVPAFSVSDAEDKLEIVTENLIVTYDKKPFSPNGLTVQVLGNPYLRKTGIWFYGDESFLREGNLLGTATTLDNAVGEWYYRDSPDETKVWGEPDKPVELCYGLMSKNGFSVIDDSRSLLLREDGWVQPAPDGHIDLYFLSYGRDYLGCLHVFYHLTGKTPMLPRYALGNWWSRYYSYTQDEYMALMDRFWDEDIPIAVSVLDMGWHYVDIDPKYGKGWTGYSWNRALFPDPAGMMKELHDRGLHVSLNVHPADGVRAHEDAYRPMAEALGVDHEHEIPIAFDVTDRKFMDAYFQYLHHPHEEMGVDFWWLDWQQGSNTRVPGYDPLWMLNHYHYTDNARSGKRPMDFSRFAGLGSHRYPIGFSGSTFITWESLDFQPYFTANASNVGYGWWSHDIGGHRHGYREDELTTRWVQFGVFSPIMRLHSSDEVFTGKEPWKFCADSERVMRRFLKLRHQLIPYLYTMNHRAWQDDQPLVQPMYYRHPDAEEAYRFRNEYWFGSALIVSPITAPTDRETRTGMVKTWLPDGLWYDVFTGVRYHGDRVLAMHRTIDSIPVLAKAGGILPMQPIDTLSSRTDNPEALEICVFAGTDGRFTLYEDDGLSMDYMDGSAAYTEMKLSWSGQKRFILNGVSGDGTLIPSVRRYTIRLYGVPDNSLRQVLRGGTDVACSQEYDAKRGILTVHISDCPTDEYLTLVFDDSTELIANNLPELAYDAINRAQIPFATKESVYKLLLSGRSTDAVLSTLQATYIPESMRSVLRELLLA